MQETRVKVNQIELQTREYECDGDAILFLHFGGANLMMWQPVVPYFRDHYRLILVDLRGHGKSDKPKSGYHMDDMARDVIGIMQKLDLERVHIIGSSLGAEVGLSIAANYPENVLSLVCDGALYSEFGPYGIWEGSEADFEEHISPELQRVQNTPEVVFPSVEALVERRHEILEKNGWWNEYVEAVEIYGAHQTDDGYVRSFGKQAREDYIKHYFQYRFEEYYKKVTCPVAMLPDEDVLNDVREKAAMQGLAGLAKQARIVEVPGWNHPYGWLLQPGPVSEAILKFLAGASL